MGYAARNEAGLGLTAGFGLLKGGGLKAASMARVAKMAETLGLKFVPFCIVESKAKQALPLTQRLAAA